LAPYPERGQDDDEARDHGPIQSPAAPSRRRWLQGLPFAAAAAGTAAAAPAPARMPGDPPQHRVVYQLNQGDAEYIEHILNSVGALIGKYEDDVAIAVVAFGPGIHLLARQPRRPVPEVLRQRARSQARDYGVRYVACGNTMKTLGWTKADMADFAQVEDVGAAVLMELQAQGWAYIAW
jgi:hypothetical protein